MTLQPGAGAAFYNPSSAPVHITFVGRVPTGSLTNTLHPGLNFVSSILPVEGDLSASSFISFPNLSGGQFDGDQVLMYFNTGIGNGGYTTFTTDSLNYNPPGNYGWDGLAGQPDPVTTNVTQAFWYRAGNGPVQWIENFYPFGDVTSSSAIATASAAGSPPTRSPDIAGSPVMFKNRQFRFVLTGPAGKSHVVEASSDLKTWRPIGTNLWTTGKFVFTDPAPATNKSRFYRSYALP
jgi:hypothetical protein